MKNYVIVNAGKGLGLSLARRFGREGFRPILIARTEEKLIELVSLLRAEDIEADYAVADATKKEEIEQALATIEKKYNQIDVLQYNATTTGKFPPTTALEMDPESIVEDTKAILGGIYIVNFVSSKMIARKDGALLFTTALSGMDPVWDLANYGVVMAGLRNYIANLHTELTPHNVLVAHRSLGVMIKDAGTGNPDDPEVIANMWYETYANCTKWEDVYPEGITAETMF